MLAGERRVNPTAAAGAPIPRPSRLSVPSGQLHDVDYEALMGMALTEAELAIPHGDVPVGAIVVVDGEIIASRHNERQLTTDPTAHAEVLASEMLEKLGTWRLDNAELIVTLEPCAMCAGALVNARISRVV